MSAHLTSQRVVQDLDAALKDPAGQLYTTSQFLLTLFPAAQLEETLSAVWGTLPSRFSHYGLGSLSIFGSPGATADYLFRSYERGGELGKRRDLQKLMRAYTISRPTIALEDREKGLVRSLAVLCADRSITPQAFEALMSEFCWHSGDCVLFSTPKVAADPLEPQARKLLLQVLNMHVQPYPQFLQGLAAQIAGHRGNGQASGAAIQGFLNQGSSWAEIDAASTTFSLTASAASLEIGASPASGRLVYYSGDESLITVAAPGTGKSQVQVIRAARRYLAIFSRSSRLRAAMSRSDWTPAALRSQPGTTVYLCLSGDDIDTYMPIVRLILQQHATVLLGAARARGEPPITFFLDEFPQLGRMESIQRLLDVGRGAGLRLWLFAQYLGQLREAYGKRADGLLNACRVRTFMQPDNDAARLLRPQLGSIEHLFSGQRRPLAEDYELMGEAFADKMIITARGHAPVLLGKRHAYEDLGAAMQMPPPVARRGL